MSIKDDVMKMPPELARIVDPTHAGTYLVHMANVEFIADNEANFTQIHLLHENNANCNPSPLILIVENKIRENDIVADIYLKCADLIGFDSESNPIYGDPYFKAITYIVPKYSEFDKTFYLGVYNAVEVVSVIAKYGKTGDKFSIYALGDFNAKLLFITNFDEIRDAMYQGFDCNFAGFKLCHHCRGLGTDPETGGTCSTCSGNGQTDELSARRWGLDRIGADSNLVRWECQKFLPGDDKEEKDRKDRLFRHRVHGQRMWITPRVPDIKNTFARFLDKEPEDIRIYEDVGYTHDARVFDIDRNTINWTFTQPLINLYFSDAQFNGNVIEVSPAYSESEWILAGRGWNSNPGQRSNAWGSQGTGNDWSYLLRGTQEIRRTDNYYAVNSVSFDIRSQFQCITNTAGTHNICCGLNSSPIQMTRNTIPQQQFPLPSSNTNVEVTATQIRLKNLTETIIFYPKGNKTGNTCVDDDGTKTRTYAFHIDAAYLFGFFLNNQVVPREENHCYLEESFNAWIKANAEESGYNYRFHQERGARISKVSFRLNVNDIPHLNECLNSSGDVTCRVSFMHNGGWGEVYVERQGDLIKIATTADDVNDTQYTTQSFAVNKYIDPNFKIWFYENNYGHGGQDIWNLNFEALYAVPKTGTVRFEYDITDEIGTVLSNNEIREGDYVSQIHLARNDNPNAADSITYAGQYVDMNNEIRIFTETLTDPAVERFVNINREIKKITMDVTLTSNSSRTHNPTITPTELYFTRVPNAKKFNITIPTDTINGNNTLIFRANAPGTSGFYLDHLVLHGYKPEGTVISPCYELNDSVEAIRWIEYFVEKTDGYPDEQTRCYYRAGQSRYECEHTAWVGPVENGRQLIHLGEGYRFVQWRIILTPTKTSTPYISGGSQWYLKVLKENTSELPDHERVPYGPIWILSLPTTYGPMAWWKPKTPMDEGNAREISELAETVAPANTVVRVEYYVPAYGSPANYDTEEKLTISDAINVGCFDNFEDNFDDDVVGNPPDGWVISGAGVEVSEQNSFSEPNSLALFGGAAPQAGIILENYCYGSFGMECKIYMTTDTASPRYHSIAAIESHVLLGDPADITAAFVGFYSIAGVRSIIYGQADVGINSGATWEFETWYKVYLRGNVVTQKYWFKVENANTGQLIVELGNIDFNVASNYIKAMGCMGGGKIAFFDDFKFFWLSGD